MKLLKRVKAYLYFVIGLSFLPGCAAPNDIQLEKVTETSEYLHCDKVFSNSRDSIVQLNEILIQTGTVDTLEDRTVKAAVIHVEGRELILDMVKGRQLRDEYQEQYAGKGYLLELNYKPRNVGSETVYDGGCQIWHGKLHSKIKVEGIRNNL